MVLLTVHSFEHLNNEVKVRKWISGTQKLSEASKLYKESDIKIETLIIK
jgi:hypothetical protein